MYVRREPILESSIPVKLVNVAKSVYTHDATTWRQGGEVGEEGTGGDRGEVGRREREWIGEGSRGIQRR